MKFVWADATPAQRLEWIRAWHLEYDVKCDHTGPSETISVQRWDTLTSDAPAGTVEDAYVLPCGHVLITGYSTPTRLTNPKDGK